MKSTFDTIGFLTTAAVDIDGELTDLDQLITEFSIPGTDPQRARRQYNHISSLLTGIMYTVGYLEENETRQGIEGWLEQMQTRLGERRPPILAALYSDKLHKQVRITACHASDGDLIYYELEIDGQHRSRRTRLEEIRDTLREMAGETAAA